jgi:UDP-3-O-[3-hydroxymyristoyl] glucosamine N-acyltransferase
MKTREIAEFLNAELVGDGDVEIVGAASADIASEGDIVFVSKTESEIAGSPSCVLAPLDFSAPTFPVIKVADPKLAFAKVAELLYADQESSVEINPTAVISESADVALEVSIGAFVCIGSRTRIGSLTRIASGSKIGENVTIGRNCVLHPNVVIEDGCTIGDNVVLHAGVVIGADGFGYVRDEHRYVKFPQIGTVVIEDDVEIGANSCIDRGALGETRIGQGTKIDNLVQIAHNVQIGKRVVIAAQTGISGSTVIEDDCVIGGQVGMGDHATVKTGAIIGSQAGVLPGKIVRAGVWWGTPVRPLDEYKRQNAMVKGLGRLRDEVRDLKGALGKLSKETIPREGEE